MIQTKPIAIGRNGLDKRDSEARLLSDGKRLSFNVEYMAGETPKRQTLNCHRKLETVGIDATSKLLTGELLGERIVNMADKACGSDKMNIYFPKEPGFMVPSMGLNEPPG